MMAGSGFNSSKYTQLLAVIEEIGKDIRPTYAGNKSSAERPGRIFCSKLVFCADHCDDIQNSFQLLSDKNAHFSSLDLLHNIDPLERLKRGIVHARILVREALMEAERSARQ